jgi:hypothetical protein
MSDNSKKRDREEKDSEDSEDEQHREKLKKEDNLEFNKKIMADLAELTEKIVNIGKAIDTMAGVLSSFKDEMKISIGTITTEILSLKSAQAKFETRINDIEQQNLASSFIVTGLPSTVKLEPIVVLNKILRQFGEVVEDSDIKKLFSIQYPNKSGSMLLGTFWSEKRKNDIFIKWKESLKQKKYILVEQIFTLDTDSTFRGKQINLRNSLTKTNSALLKQALTYKNRPFKRVYEMSGKIFVKFTETSKAVNIKSIEQLNDLASMQPAN